MLEEKTMLENVALITASVSAVIVSCVAVYGINVWRREHVGRRRIDLAEEVLALSYEVTDAISAARIGIFHMDEGSTRKAYEDETSLEKEARDEAYIVIERLQRRNDLFAKFRSLRYRFKAQNGQESAQPFEDLLAIRSQLMTSCLRLWRPLLQDTNAYAKKVTPEALKKLHEKIDKERHILYGNVLEVDTIAENLERIITDIEKTCRDIIQGSRRPLRALWLVRYLRR